MLTQRCFFNTATLASSTVPKILRRDTDDLCHCTELLNIYNPHCCHLILKKKDVHWLVSARLCDLCGSCPDLLLLFFTPYCHFSSFSLLSDALDAQIDLACGFIQTADSGVGLWFKGLACFSPIKCLYALKLSFLGPASYQLYDPLRQKQSLKTLENIQNTSSDSL